MQGGRRKKNELGKLVQEKMEERPGDTEEKKKCAISDVSPTPSDVSQAVYTYYLSLYINVEKKVRKGWGNEGLRNPHINYSSNPSSLLISAFTSE